MPLINVVIILVIVGVLMYLVNRYIPMQEAIKTILNVVVILVVLLWLLGIFGIGNLTVPVHQVRP